METTADLATNIRMEMARKNIGQTALAEASGVSKQVVNRVVHGGNTSMETVLKIAKGLDVSLAHLFREPERSAA